MKGGIGFAGYMFSEYSSTGIIANSMSDAGIYIAPTILVSFPKTNDDLIMSPEL
ncbi:MAG: hypothetical protein K0B02_05230 [DPANN group archaeon]|nr:hypothetical protein [DPANN group archaeon]